MDGRGLWYFEPLFPITLATFDSAPRGLKGICGVAVSIGDVNGELFDMEARCPDGAAAVRLGLDGVKTANVSYVPIDNANGEHIKALDSFYFRNSGLAGFKVRKVALPITSLGLVRCGLTQLTCAGCRDPHQQRTRGRIFYRSPR